MPNDTEYIAYLKDLLGDFGNVVIKRMFGGHGVFRDGLMFALVTDDVLYFKVDDDNRPRFEQHDLPQFSYVKKGKAMKMSYYQAPEEVFDNEEEMIDWATGAFDAALKKAQNSKNKKRK
jgi:DNA transformation protein